MARPYTYRDIRAEYAMQSGTGDPWGECMGFWFTIAGELWRRNARIPDAWQYRPSPLGGVDPDDTNAPFARKVKTEALMRFGEVLNRYAKRLKRAGLDY